MIDLKYTLSRDEGDEIVEFKNPLKEPIDNLSILKGNNSLGKSTILNIISYGLFGLNNETIVPTLRNKMKILESQNLSFEFEIAREDIGLKLVSKKSDANKHGFELVEYKGSKMDTISREIFENDYNLIYDIPDQTMDRLRRSIDEIQTVQRRYGENVQSFRKFVVKTIEDIEKNSNPEKVMDLKRQFQEARQKQDSLKKISEQDSNLSKDLWMFASCKYYHEYDIKLKDSINIKQNLIQRRDQILKGLEKIPKARNKFERSLGTKRNEIKDLKSTTIDTLFEAFGNKKSTVLENINALKIDESFDRGRFSGEDMETIYSVKEALIKAEREETIKTQNMEEGRIYSELIEILEKHGGSNIKIPGVEKTVAEFIQMLKDANAKNDTIFRRLSKVKKARESLSLLETAILDANEALEKAKDVDAKDTTNDRQELIKTTKEISDFEKTVSSYEKKKGFYFSKLLEYQIDPDAAFRYFKELENTPLFEDYSFLSEQAILNKIGELENQRSDRSNKAAAIEKQMSILEDKIREMENSKPHKFQDKIAEIRRILTIAKSVDDTLRGGFKEYLDAISEGKKIDIRSESSVKYHTAISKYLGARIGAFRYQDSYLETESIDLINGTISFKGGKKIPMEYISTGQSQNAYLQNLLNTEDKRKMIVLLDEVGMISLDTLRPVFDKIRSLYAEGRLMACIVAQVTEDKKIVAENLVS